MYLAEFLLTLRKFSDKGCRESQYTFYSQLLISENPAIYKTTWKNIAEPDRPQITWRMRCADWTTKDIDTLDGISTATMVTRKQVNVTFTRALPALLKIPYRTYISGITNWLNSTVLLFSL
jgi:hypothetical protein